jgi:NitT/TauT family transport system substrate-binding protein
MQMVRIGLLAAILWGLGCTTAVQPPSPAVSPVPGGSAAAPTPARLERLTIPISQVTTSNVAWFLAQDGGIFARHGLDVELVNLGSGQTAQAALLSGEVMVTASSGPAAVSAIVAGANVTIVSVTLDTLPFQLVAVPEVRSVADLRGTTIGINRLGGSPHVVLRYMLRHGGVDADQDVRVIQIGQQPERMAALRSGAIQATLLIPPLGTIVERDGLRIVADSADLGLAYPNGVTTVNRDWLRTNRDTARRVVQSLQEAKRAYKTDRELAIRTMQHWLDLDDPPLLDATYTYFSKILEDWVLPRPEGLQMVLDEIAEDRPEARTLRPDDLVDPSLAAEVK